MNTKNSFNTNKFSLNIIRFLIVLLIYSSSLKIDTIFTVSNWKIYFFIFDIFNFAKPIHKPKHSFFRYL